jgi:hypothetical protein
MVRSSFPRHQQYRRLRRAAASGTTAIAAGALAIIALGTGAPALGGALAIVMIGLAIDTRRWLRLAGRSRVGARSEDAVRAALAALEAEGWQVRHSLPYRGHGDIDSVAIGPTGIACAKRKPDRSTRVTSPVSGRWPLGFTVAGDGGGAAERSRFCASCVREAWSASRMAF